jgi:hypothetical protein
MAYTFPIIKNFKGVTREQTDCIAIALRGAIKIGNMSQMALAVGLCNALSLCFEAGIRNVKTKEHQTAILELEMHLEHVVNLLNHLRRHPEDIPQNNPFEFR